MILEVNSVPVSSPEQLQKEIAKARDSVKLKVASPAEDKNGLGLGQVVTKTKSKTNHSTTHDGQETLVSTSSMSCYMLNCVKQKKEYWFQIQSR